jgi:hypothetical protein
LGHEALLFLGGLRDAEGVFFKQPFLDSEIRLPPQRKQFNSSFRTGFVAKFLRVAYIMAYSVNVCTLSSGGLNPDLIFDKSSTSLGSLSLYGIEVPPIETFHVYAMQIKEGVLRSHDQRFRIFINSVLSFKNLFVCTPSSTSTQSTSHDHLPDICNETDEDEDFELDNGQDDKGK